MPRLARPTAYAALTLALVAGTLSACLGGQNAAQPDDRFLNLAPDAAYAGSASCASCHAEIYAGYQEHGMAKSFYRLTPENAVEDWSGVPVHHEASGFTYVARRDGDRFVQVEFLEDVSGTRTHELTRTMDYVMGSGSAARTYFSEENGRLYELPLTWYTQSADDPAQGTTVGEADTAQASGGHWAFSPGYETSNGRFERTVPDRCMACHNDVSEAVPFAEDKYASLASGIGCEQCHGPGALHVEARTETENAPDSIDVTIVNPKHLALGLRLDVCQQCHLNGEVSVLRDGETATSFRPGRPLSAHRAIFGLATSDPTRVSVISHADRMKQSACFLESDSGSPEGAMDCVTCHNPHQGFRTRGPEVFDRTCRSCHAPDALQAAMPSPALKAQHTAAAPCFSCHMPKVTADDAPHASFTDHWIRVVGRDDRVSGVAADGDLAPYFDEDEADGLYAAMAYVVYGRQKGDAAASRQGTGLLAALLEREPEHGEAQFLLGFARLQSGDARGAVAPLQAAVDDAPNPERLNALAQALEATGRPAADAERLYRQALQIQPAAAGVRVNLGRLLESQQRIPEAVAEYRAAIDEEPWLTAAHTLLGGALARAGDVPGAVAALREATHLDPRQADALTNLGVLIAQSGDVRAAGGYLRRAVAAGPRNANAHANLALYFLNEQRPQEAFASAQQALTLNPQQATAQQVLSILQQAAQ